jgi:hypothetical protein
METSDGGALRNGSGDVLYADGPFGKSGNSCALVNPEKELLKGEES